MAAVVAFVAKVIATKVFMSLTVKAILVAAVKVAASYAISRALMKSSKSKSAGLGSGAGSELVMSREPAPARRVIYGESRVSGPMAFAHLSGSGNSLLHYVILLASHECADIGAVLMDDEQVTLSGSGEVIAGKHTGKARIIQHLGDQTTADATLVSECGTAWTSSFVLRGITYLYVRLTYDADVYSGGLPNISVVLRGKKCYDPRTSTTVFTRNPAIILRDYLTNDDYGIGATADEIDDGSFIAAANICDESAGSALHRYQCDGTFTTDAEPAVVIEQILSTMGGNLVYAGGKFRCNAGAYMIPTASIDESDLRGPIQFQTAAGIRDSANIVKGTFTSPSDLYQTRDFPAYRDATHISEDGEEIVSDLDLAWVSSAEQAQRLAKIAERQSRLGGVISLQCNLSAMRVQAGDTISISNQRFGWYGKAFLVQEFKFAIDDGGALGVDLVCRETSSDVYGWVAGTDEKVLSPGLVFYNPDRLGDASIVATLDNDFTACPSASDGSSPVLTNAVTTIQVLRYGQDDSANWTYSATPSAGVTGSLIGRTWTTTGFTADAGYVEITASRSGFASLPVRFTLAKMKAGAAGTNGTSTALVTLYKRAASTPAVPSTTSTFTFSTGALTGHNNGWTQTVPANDGNPLYVTTAAASSTGVSDTIATGEWAAPVIHAQNGTAGTNGMNSSVVFLFKRTATSSAPAVPSTTSTYTFSTKALTGHDNGWTQSMPTTGGSYRWQTTASALSQTDNDTIATGEWSTPAITSEDGLNGSDATSYSLVSSVGAIAKATSGAYTPTTITFTGKSQTGTGSPADYAGRFIVSESTDGATFSTVYTSAGNESSVTRTPSAGIKAIRCQMYLAGGTTNLIDMETVPIVADGATGANGTNGATVLASGGNGGSWSGPAMRDIVSVAATAPNGSTHLCTVTGYVSNNTGSPATLTATVTGGIYQSWTFSAAAGQRFDFNCSIPYTATGSSQSFVVAIGSNSSGGNVAGGASITVL